MLSGDNCRWCWSLEVVTGTSIDHPVVVMVDRGHGTIGGKGWNSVVMGNEDFALLSLMDMTAAASVGPPLRGFPTVETVFSGAVEPCPRGGTVLSPWAKGSAKLAVL